MYPYGSASAAVSFQDAGSGHDGGLGRGRLRNDVTMMNDGDLGRRNVGANASDSVWDGFD